jgi:hypothetical protein
MFRQRASQPLLRRLSRPRAPLKLIVDAGQRRLNAPIHGNQSLNPARTANVVVKDVALDVPLELLEIVLDLDNLIIVHLGEIAHSER